MDNDLISRSALIERETYMFDEALGWTACVLTEDIKDAPAVDAVPVVRCGKCKHTETDGCEDPAIYCKKWDRWEMPPDFYCGYGERKT